MTADSAGRSELDSWSEVRAFFQAAIELPQGERESWLRRRLASEPALFGEVLALVQTHEEDPTFLELPVFAQGDAGADDGGERRIGSYAVRAPLGAGGMGVVFHAVRLTDGLEVALKVLRHGPFPDARRRRFFEREIRSLGRLRHPSIAGLVEAGTTVAGLPWFAMELVRGVPLGDWARSRAPSQREILDVFCRICAAVEYSHAEGIVHRDLKPANVFVCGPDADAIKVLDFGLATVAEDVPGASTFATESGRVLGTLAYASPEQVRGDRARVGPAADVWSLGALLYELLTGRLPLDVAGLSVPAAIRLVCEGRPPSASEVAPALDPATDVVLARALEKEPGRRYPSVRELREDVEHVLAGEATRARPPGPWQRARDAARRHPVVCAVGGTLLVAAVATAAISTALLWSARASEERALASRDAAHRIERFVQRMLVSADPLDVRGQGLTVREVLDGASRDLDRSLAEEPLVAARMHGTLASAYRSLGLVDRADEHLAAALALARARPDGARERAHLTHQLGELRLRQGRYSDAELAYRKAIEAWLEPDPDPRAAAAAEAGLGNALRFQGRYDEAAESFRSAIETLRRPSGDPEGTLGSVLNDRAGLAMERGEFELARELYEEALERVSGAHGAQSALAIGVRSNLAALLQSTRRYELASERFEETLAAYVALAGEEHPDVATLLNNLGNCLSYAGRTDEAEDALRRALELRGRLLGRDHPHYASTVGNLGSVLLRKGDVEAARELFAESLELRRAALGEEHAEVGLTHRMLALANERLGRTDEARRHAETALAVLRRVLPAAHPELATALLVCGRTLARAGHFDEAEPLLMELWRDLTPGPGHSVDERKALEALVELYTDWGRAEEAQRFEDRLLALGES